MRRSFATIALCAAAASLSACGAQGDGVLRQISPGDTVFIEGWDSWASEGDEARVEKKPSGMWVVPMSAPFRRVKDDTFKVEVKLTKEDGFVVVNMNGVRVGLDHDNCLAPDEIYVKMAVGDPAQEVNKGGKPDGDCDLTENEQ